MVFFFIIIAFLFGRIKSSIKCCFYWEIIASLLFPLKYALAVLQGSSSFHLYSSLRDRATSQVGHCTEAGLRFLPLVLLCFSVELPIKKKIFLIISASSCKEWISLDTGKDQLEKRWTYCTIKSVSGMFDIFHRFLKNMNEQEKCLPANHENWNSKYFQ